MGSSMQTKFKKKTKQENNKLIRLNKSHSGKTVTAKSLIELILKIPFQSQACLLNILVVHSATSLLKLFILLWLLYLQKISELIQNLFLWQSCEECDLWQNVGTINSVYGRVKPGGCSCEICNYLELLGEQKEWGGE